MLSKYCTQYASKFRKLSSGHRTRKSLCFLIPKKGNTKECSYYWITALISHTKKVMFKPFKLGFSSMWTKNFQMNKVGLEKVEEPEIKLSTFIGSWRKQGNSRKTSTSLTTLKPLTVWITTNCGKFLEMRIPDHLTFHLRNLHVGQEATVKTLHAITNWSQIGKEAWQGCILSLW